MNKTGYKQYLWRGAIGGVIGGLTFLVLAIAFNLIFISYLDETLTRLFWAVGAVTLLSGVLWGGVIGFIIWVVSMRRGREPGAFERFLIGAGTLLAFSLVTGLLEGRPYRLPFLIICASIYGGLPGLFARSRDIASSEQVTGRA